MYSQCHNPCHSECFVRIVSKNWIDGFAMSVEEHYYRTYKLQKYTVLSVD
jgi:hypothetical protein